MANDGVFGGWYRTHLGEPLEPDHVNGYWAFLFGAFLALVGLVLFLVAAGYERGSDNFWLFRRVAFTLALVAGPIVVLSIVYLLPLQARAAWLATLGLLLCVGAAIAFNVYYPDDWNWAGDMSPVIMGGYGAGIALQILTIFLYPLVSSGTAQPDVLPASEADDGAEAAAAASAADTSKATFQLYEDRASEHRWRLVHDNGNVIADSGEGYASRQKARQGMSSVKQNAPGAEEEILERVPEDAPAEATASEPAMVAEDGGEDAASPTAATDDAGDDDADDDGTAFEFGPTDDAASDDTATDEAAVNDEATDDASADATFEVYEDNVGEYRWRLRHSNGNVIADPGEGYSRRSAVNEAVERIKRVASEADTLEYEPAAFELYADAADEWRWRLRHRNGRILADSGEGYASRRNAKDGVESVRKHVADPENVEVYEDNAGDYRWRLTASNGELIADSGQGYSRESRAQDAVERVSEYAPEADTLDYEPAAYEVFQDNAEEWRWRLRHRNGQILADSGEGYASKQKARQGMHSVMNNAPAAEIEELE
ncbi:hypothetical protein L593_06940 [Salinarchaeum sp. Harcht-Bsk1]|uniref:HVO_2922 family protein n=1 Tax=Salinarchaeum sp. Harcht-Bsk1 TaxID=1333523 RepID=UPI0003423C08|nr:HVO_2922 family protein [Salinarchaeum sp. Harcht-Bsk1]AGN01335.1 hypothetical protein L593_06940 [Salinarchaeum sp. Harcht-Bsk1]